MANKKVSALDSAVLLIGTELIPIVQPIDDPKDNKKVTIDAILDILKDGVPTDGDTLNKLYALITSSGGGLVGDFSASGGGVPGSALNKKGQSWRISVAGTIVGLLSGPTTLNVGDLLIANQDAATVAGHFFSISGLVTKATINLGNVPNVDTTNPSNITQDSTHRFATDTEKATWNAKQNALGFTPEDVSNKATNLASNDNTHYPTTAAVKTADDAILVSSKAYTDGVVAGSFNYRGTWAGTGNNYPTIGGTGAAGAVAKGNAFEISIPVTIQGIDYDQGDIIVAKIDSPGQTTSNWGASEHNTQQATESVRGTAKLADQTTIQIETTTNDTDVVTAKKWWLGIARFVQLAWTWTLKQTFTTAPRFSSVTASQYLKVDGTKDLMSVSAIPATDVTEDSTHRFATDTEKSTWNGKQNGFTPTTIKTAAYNAVAGDLIITDASASNVPITLPTTPTDKTVVAVKMIAASGSFVTTIGTGGADVFNKAGGSTSLTLTLVNQAILLQYQVSTGIWYVMADDLSLAQLDLRYFLASNIDTDSALTANSDTKLASQKATRTFVLNQLVANTNGLNWKSSVKAASTANLTLSGAQTIDGVSCVAGDRVLAKDQTTASQNGIYVVASGAWTRATDLDATAEFQNAVVSVDQGTVNGDTSWRQTTDNVVVGTSSVVWAPFNSSSVYNAVAAGTNTYTATVSPAISAYATWQMFAIKFTNANTLDSPTLNISSLGAKTLKKQGGTNLVIGDIVATQLYIIVYDGTNLQVIGVIPNNVLARQFSSTIQTLTDAATIAWDGNLGQNVVVTLGGNRTLGAITNPINGTIYTLRVIQDATGNRTLAFNAAYLFNNSITALIDRRANGWTVLRFWYNGTNFVYLDGNDEEGVIDLGNLTGAVSIDLSLGRKFKCTQTGNWTSFTFTNEVIGRSYALDITRTSNYTVAYTAGKFRFPLGQSPSLTNPTTNGLATSTDKLSFECAVASRLDVVITPDLQNN
jgi:hypothetical protein